MLNESLKYAIAPLDIADGQKEVNLEALERLLPSLDRDTDIVILPELFTTGFSADKDTLVDLSETVLGPTVDRIQRLATLYHMAICGSFLCRVGGQLFNRGFIIEPNGDETFYDKRHLFCISNESKMLHQGTAHPPVVRYRGWNISLIVCYDLRFPIWCRNIDCAYDLMVVTANWPESRRYAWDSLLKARAIENQAYYLACNRSGSDEYGEYPESMSFAVDYTGHILEDTLRGSVKTGVIEKGPLNKYRNRFPFWRDADG